MTQIGEVDSPAAWRAPDMETATHWRRRLKPTEIDEIDAGFRHAKAAGGTLGNLSQDQFPLPQVSKVLVDIRDKLETGPGINLLKGFPVDKYSVDDLRLIYWGLAIHLGTPVEQ
ncbi:MAG: taurine catabolism dioxygenase TauD, partial [Proteobacteria bacterium]|nr:taurine catabolism dioxygenase TauD [Pseudomonadota bacterium]